MTKQWAAYFLLVGVLALVTSCSLATSAQGQSFRGPDGRMYCQPGSTNCSQPNRSAGVYLGGSVGLGVGVQRSQPAARVILAIPRPSRTTPRLADLPLPTRSVATTQPKRPVNGGEMRPTITYVTQAEHRALLDVLQTLQAEVDRLKAQFAEMQEKLVPVVGEQGEQGPAGDQGPQGNTGATGPPGPPGVIDYTQLPPLPVRQQFMKRRGDEWVAEREHVDQVFFSSGEGITIKLYPPE